MRSVGVVVLVTSAALSLIIALIADLLLLPPLLLRAHRPKPAPLEAARRE